MIVVISADDPRGLKTTPGQGPPLEALVSSGIYFHFLWPSVTTALTFCLLQEKKKKKPSPYPRP